jgi:hypothetical protein
MDHKEFFDQYGLAHTAGVSGDGYYAACTVEDLYQAIKSRLLEEVVAQTPTEIIEGNSGYGAFPIARTYPAIPLRDKD